MNYNTHTAVPVLQRTPAVIRSLLTGLEAALVHQNEGNDTWSPFDVVGHLIVCEKTNYLQRIQLVLTSRREPELAALDMHAHFTESRGKSIDELIAEFSSLREMNIETLISMNLSGKELEMTGIHPKLGPVTVRQLLCTWVAHDLIHTAQIARVIARQFKEGTGPFIDYLRVIQ